jgi:hypothetical protein
MKHHKPHPIKQLYFKIGEEYVPVNEEATLAQLRSLKDALLLKSGERCSEEFDKIWKKVLPDIKAKLWDLSHAEENDNAYVKSLPTIWDVARESKN